MMIGEFLHKLVDLLVDQRGATLSEKFNIPLKKSAP
jgi:hypothetical protein